jgi:glycosyltransferase involved in cell wall biosynthesis
VGTGASAVSVVVATRNRSARLKALIESLRGQSLPADRFEVIVVDDGSDDGTPELLRSQRECSDLALRYIRRRSQGGPGCARNDGWRAAAGPLVAFIDDDCIASPRWLEAGLDACARNPGAIVQGRTEPDPAEEAAAGPFSYTIRVPKLGPNYETCNIFYPRPVLEALDGFDTEAFPGIYGEDIDLAWRAIESGTPTAFAPEAHVFHAVHRLGPREQLRRAWNWSDSILAHARHPGFRRAQLFRGAFVNVQHYALLRVLMVPLVPRRLWLLRRWFVCHYAANLLRRYAADLVKRGGTSSRARLALLLLPYHVAHDLVEMASVVLGGIRYRTFVL